MLFSSSVFLFAYLPIVLVVYYIPLRGLRRAQNLFLLAASLLFYAWGEPWFVLVMAASIAANYGFGLWVHARLCRCRSVRLPVAAAASEERTNDLLFSMGVPFRRTGRSGALL